MFTGIVAGVGSVISNAQVDTARQVEIELSALHVQHVAIGDSIAVSGICLTVNRLQGHTGFFDVSGETLEKCLVDRWKPGTQVNLEMALTLQTPIGGHLVSGHVDGQAEVCAVEPCGEFTNIAFAIPVSLSPFVAVKGSIAIDGVSLTINNVVDAKVGTEFDVMLVPHTLERTTLGLLNPGDSVHVEVDQLARYASRILELDRATR